MQASAKQCQTVPRAGQLLLHGPLHGIFRVRKALPLLPQLPLRIVQLQAQAVLLCPVTGKFCLPLHSLIERRLIRKPHCLKLAVIEYGQFCRRRRGWCPQVCHIVRNGHVRLMAYRGDDRSRAVKDGPRHNLFVKRP